MSELILGLRKVAGAEVLTGRTARRALAVALFALLTGLGAHVAVPLPGTPVPVTLQVLFVILSGALLGARLGAAAQIAYLAAGAAGLPVFAGGAGLAYLFGPTGGYLLAFPLAAALVGTLAPRRALRSGDVGGFTQLALALLLGTAVILAGGAAQLALLTGDAARAVRLGIVPFLLGDALKILVALAVAGRLRNRTLGLS